MNNIAQIVLLDTGYPNTINDGTQESSANMANAGTAIVLNVESVDLDVSANVASDPEIGNYSDTELGFGSVANDKFVVTGLIDRTDGTAMDLLLEIGRLPKTKGVKVFYYNSTTDGYRDLTDTFGSTDAYHVSGTKHLHVRVLSFRCRQVPNSKLIRYTLSMETTS